LNDQIKNDEMGKACSMNGEKRYAYRILVGKPEGKRPLGRPTFRWEDDIVTCWVEHATNKTGSSLDDWIY
jgi:hypothetical protein